MYLNAVLKCPSGQDYKSIVSGNKFRKVVTAKIVFDDYGDCDVKCAL